MSGKIGLVDDEDELVGLVRALWAGRRLIAVVTTTMIVIAFGLFLLSQDRYRATTVLVRVEGSGLSGDLSQLGALAGMAGFKIGTGEGSEAPLAVLSSRDSAREFIESQGIQHLLTGVQERGLLRKLGFRGRSADIRDAVDRFVRDVRDIEEDSKSGLITLSTIWVDADMSAEWANTYVKLVDDRLRKEALREAESNIRYLRGELATTNVAALQTSIGRVLESEMQKFLLAKGREEYAFKVIDPATTPRKPILGRAVLAGSFGVVLGFLGACLFVVLRSRLRSVSSQDG